MKVNVKILNKVSQINTYQVLQTVSLFYIALPALLFIGGWLNVYIAVPVVCLTICGIFQSLSTAWNYAPEPNYFFQVKNLPHVKWNSYLTCVLVLALIIFMVICSGLGGYARQDGDYFKHNAFFNDLIQYSWPLAYEQTGPDDIPRVLNTYVGYYLPSALIGKIFGWSVGYFFSFVWACLGLLLTILWIQLFARGRLILIAVTFLLFGGLDYLGWEFLVGVNRFGVDYNYSTWMMFYAGSEQGRELLRGVFWAIGSNHQAMANAPHHIFPSWVCIAMIFHDSVKRRSNDRLFLVASFLPFISAFVSIGMLPFVILGVFENKFKKSLTWPNLIVGFLLASIAGLFLISNNAQFIRGWIWTFTDLRDAIPILLFFFLVGFGLYLLLMPKSKYFLNGSEQFWLTTSIFCLVLFTMYRMGAAMDFPLKVFVPAWIIFQICLITSLSRIFTSQSSFIDKIRGIILIVLIGIGSIGAISDVVVALESGLFKNHVHRNGIFPINAYKDIGSLQLFSDGQTFFWKYLAKTVVYDKSTSRETFFDKFGNKLRLDLIRCNEKQGFYVSVNGIQSGCCVKLTKNKYGFIEALDGFGDEWIYLENGWESKALVLIDKFGSSFHLDRKNQCDKMQGYQLLLNGKPNGCFKSLALTVDGTLEATDGLGDSWLFQEKKWIKK